MAGMAGMAEGPGEPGRPEPSVRGPLSPVSVFTSLRRQTNTSASARSTR
jgi:hypothetical protein